MYSLAMYLLYMCSLNHVITVIQLRIGVVEWFEYAAWYAGYTGLFAAVLLILAVCAH